MLSSPAHIALLALALAPSLASAAIFPKDTLVKMLDPKGFRKVMKQNETSLVAFVAPWCGHCQRMAPEYSKAALGLHPLIPVYAVDCDANENKRLCAEQGVKGFPTVKLFPRGDQLGSMTYDSGERTASGFWYWATRRIPKSVTTLYQVEEIAPWVEKTSKSQKHRALLLTKEKKVPLLWKVLGNKYKDQLELAAHRDRKGKSSVAMGLEAGEPKQAKVLIYPAGSTKFVRYEGINKLDSLSKFFDSVLDGTADLSALNEAAKAEEYEPTPEELEIQEKQEAQRLKLMHGGFADMVDFEKAVKEGAGAGYHDTHGYQGMMGEPPKKKAEAGTETEAKTKTEGSPAAEEQNKEAKKAAGSSCSLAEDGPGADPPKECDPPALEVEREQVVLEHRQPKEPMPPAHPKDEL
ncbi:putative thioredoxin [Lyophyllum shimeji]|uniref:Thioredoxin n=1 Tax=Lyophyllum shimeji TaxID=47721 RepID=A0A9P3PRQ2_LYOSH|nr:putative thioredoxin [Lyophyllum shimeji]